MADKDELPTIEDPDVVNKYRLAGEISNRVLRQVIAACEAGAKVIDVCTLGDAALEAETGKLFRKKVAKEEGGEPVEVKKGIAFPTCISVNNCVCHYSPIASDKPEAVLNNGDLVKIDLACHLDGFVAAVAHSFVVGASAALPVKGRAADVLQAAYLASEAALRSVKVGAKNSDVTKIIQRVAAEFGCLPVQGMLSHQLEQNVIDGKKTIILNPTEEHKGVEEITFETNEVYAVDVFVSSGEGKARPGETRTTVYKKTEGTYQLKMKASRSVFSEVSRKFDVMPFTLRSLSDEKTARLGITECQKHELVDPFNVLYEREGEVVAQFKFTVLLTANGPIRVTNGPWEDAVVQSEGSVKDEEMKALLATSANRKNKKKKKKAAKEGEGEAKTE